MNLELMAMRWLRFEKKCMIVIRERTPRICMGEPDVLGVTCNRYLTEIEIKRTVADFRCDQKKRHRINRCIWLQHSPKLIYYLVAEDLKDRVRNILPEWAGLLYATERGRIFVERSAPVNHDSKRLSIKECVRLAHLMANHLLSAEESCESIITRWRCDHEPYWQVDYEI